MAITNWFNHQKEQGNIEEMTDEASSDLFGKGKTFEEAVKNAHEQVLNAHGRNRPVAWEVDKIIRQTKAAGDPHFDGFIVTVLDLTRNAE